MSELKGGEERGGERQKAGKGALLKTCLRGVGSDGRGEGEMSGFLDA